MATTYEPIATQTLTGSAASISFTSIPSTYTDLRLVVTAIGSGASSYLALQYNGSATGYSTTSIRGNGSTVTAAYQYSQTRGFILNSSADLPTSYPALSTTDIFSYTSTTNYKTSISIGSDDKNGSGEVGALVNNWASTSAINRIDVIGYNTNLGTGTTATLFGIKAA